jgi:hypothetical protein
MSLHSQTRQQIRHYTARLLNDLLTGTVASPASGTFVCTAWEKPDDHFNKWVEIFDYSGTGIGTSGNPTDWVNSSHTLTFAPAATLTATDLVEMHRTWIVSEYNDAINMAILSVLKEGMQYSIDETIILDDILTNGGFDSGHATGWSEGGTGTFADESTIIRGGTYSGKVTNAAANAAYFYESITNYSLYVGKVMNAGADCYCTTASRVRLALTDGVTTEYSDYHTSTGWEELTVSLTPATTATALTLQLRTETGGAISVYWDNCWLAGDHIYEYTVPDSMAYIHRLDMESSTHALYTDQFGIDQFCWQITRGTTKKIKFNYEFFTPTAGRCLRVHGLVVPTTLSADTTATKVNPLFLSYQTAAYLHASRIRGKDADAEDHRAQFAFWQAKADVERQKMGVNLPQGAREVEV